MTSLSAIGACFWRDLRLFRSYRFRFATLVISAVVSLALFYYVSRLVNAGHFGGSDDYFAFVMVGMVGLRLAISTLAQPQQRLMEELVAGTFERAVVSAAGPAIAIVGLLAFPFVLTLALAAITLGAGVLVFGVELAWGTVALFVPVAALGALALAPLGVLALSVTLVAKQATAVTGFVISGLTLVSGLYFPTRILPASIRWLGDVQPLTPSVELARGVLLDQPLARSAWVDVGILVGFTVVLLPVSLLVLRRVLEYTRMRGTLIES